MSALTDDVLGLGWVFTSVSGVERAYDLDRIRAHLDYLEEAWPDVLELRTPSNRLVVVRRRAPDAEARARQVALQELAEARLPGAVTPPGRRPVPVDVTALDLLSEIASVAEYSCEVVEQSAGVERTRHVGSVYEDPRGRLLRARSWLSAAAEAAPGAMPEVERRLAGAAARAAWFLGDVLDGQVLDAVCPWCGGRTELAPVGGERTLRVVAPGARRRAANTEPALLVCFGLNCDPGERMCGSRYRGQPAWPEWEWEWLAPLLASREEGDEDVAEPLREPRVLRFVMEVPRDLLLNSNDRPHWSKRHRLEQHLQVQSGYAARAAMGREPVRFERAEMWVRMLYPDRRHRDDHNLMPTVKPIVDGLVKAKVIPDDRRQFLRGPWLSSVAELSGKHGVTRFEFEVREVLTPFE